MNNLFLSTLPVAALAGNALGTNVSPMMRKGGHQETPEQRAAAAVDNTLFARYEMPLASLGLAINALQIHLDRTRRNSLPSNNLPRRHSHGPIHSHPYLPQQ